VTALVASAIAVLVGCGTWLLLRARIFPVILGLMLVGYAVNLFLLAAGRLDRGAAPIIADGGGPYADPLPQALVLTAIVIGFGMTAFLVALALRARRTLGTDHVDGVEPSPARDGR
jgi:multicomponent K+:H+ antiporter subunit C